MSVKAGTTLTTAHLSHSSKGTTLSNDVASATSTDEQWGTEQIVFTNPGVAVEVTADVTGRFVNEIDATSNGTVRVGISLDGGSTFTYGNSPFVKCGTEADEWVTVAASHSVSGDPTGDIVVQAIFRVSDLDLEPRNGQLNATMIPAA